MDELKLQLCDDIAKLFKKDKELVKENTDKSLFCNPIYLTTEEMLYLYFHIKENYKESLHEKQIMAGAFQSIEDIHSLVS